MWCHKALLLVFNVFCVLVIYPPRRRPGREFLVICNITTLQEQQQGENRVKSMLFHMSGEGALLTTYSKRCSPPGANVPVEWICRHRAQPNSSHIPPPQGHLGAAVAFGKGAVGGETLPARRSWRSISAAADQLFRDVLLVAGRGFWYLC